MKVRTTASAYWPTYQSDCWQKALQLVPKNSIGEYIYAYKSEVLVYFGNGTKSLVDKKFLLPVYEAENWPEDVFIQSTTIN